VLRRGVDRHSPIEPPDLGKKNVSQWEVLRGGERGETPNKWRESEAH